MRIAVVGGGIGGLTAAIALRRVGADVEVYEQAAELREVGAGIVLASNALHALELLGLGAELAAEGIASMQGGLRRPDGDMLMSVAGDELSRRLGRVAVVHRAELLTMLLRHAEPGRVHLGARCVSVEQDAGGVTVRFENGESIRADAVIAADGLRSRVRAQLFTAATIRYAGYTAWRAVVNAAESGGTISETWGRGCRFGIVPMARGRVYWFAVQNAPEGQQDPSGGTKRALTEMFRGWHRPVEELIGAATEGTIVRNDIYDIDPMPRLAMGRVALLGDAAHAMTPNLGQGGCQAIEDAVVLAACVKTAPSLDAAFLTYERRRLPRTRRIQTLSRRIGVIGQLAHPLACGLRDFALRMTPASSGSRQLKSLYGEPILSTDEERMLIAREPANTPDARAGT